MILLPVELNALGVRRNFRITSKLVSRPEAEPGLQDGAPGTQDARFH